MKTFTSLLAFAFCLFLSGSAGSSVSSSKGSDAPAQRAELWISITVPEQNSVVATDDRSHFHVTIENVSDHPQNVFDEWNSWGCFSFRFEYTTPTGKEKVMEKLPRVWTKNNPTTTPLNPGEILVRDVYLDSTIWSNLPLPAAGEAMVRIRASFEQKPVQGEEAWHGQITCPAQEITFRNARQRS